MRIDIQYLIDYGEHIGENERKSEWLARIAAETVREAEQHYTYKKFGGIEQSCLRSEDIISYPHWSFPNGRGSIQPWRRKLWERQNKF